MHALRLGIATAVHRPNPTACVLLAGVCLAAGGCTGIVDPQAKATLESKLGNTTITVYPTAVREAQKMSYDSQEAAKLADFFAEQGLATATLSTEPAPITGPWHMNQARMLRESAAAFAAHLAEHPIETDYALLAEYLTGGRGHVGGIHCYLLDADGNVAYAVLLNSHHKPFTDANPQTAADCTAVLLRVMKDDLKPASE